MKYKRLTSFSSSIGTTAHCGLWPVEQCPSIFSYLPPTFTIFSLPALEDLFLLPLSILSWVFPFVSTPSRSWVEIFLSILSSFILSRWPNQLILCPFIHFTIFSPLLISSSSRFVLLFHSTFSYLGPYILLNIFLSKISRVFLLSSSTSMLLPHTTLPLQKIYYLSKINMSTKHNLNLIGTFSSFQHTADTITCLPSRQHKTPNLNINLPHYRNIMLHTQRQNRVPQMSLPCHENKFGMIRRYGWQSGRSAKSVARNYSITWYGRMEAKYEERTEVRRSLFYTQCKAQVHP